MTEWAMGASAMKADKYDSANYDSWVTRLQATDLLGCSTNTLRVHEVRGRLHPRLVYRRDERGVARELYVYDPVELSKIPKRERYVVSSDPGEIAARAFELFDQGQSLRAVVIATREMPAKVLELHQQWLDMGGAAWVINAPARAILESTIGPCASIAEVIERIVKITGGKGGG